MIKEVLKELSTNAFLSVSDCKERITAWLTDESIPLTDKDDIISLIKNKNTTELRDRFYRDLEFGTGGLRGVMGMGSNRMNRHVLKSYTRCSKLHFIVWRTS